MENIIEIIKQEVYERCLSESNAYGIGAWTHHILTVYNIATSLYEEYDADLEVVSLAALLHDVASVTNADYTEKHHIIGASIADELLTNLNYDKEKLELVKKCILNHRGSVVKKKISNEEICIADSDALAHFYNIPSLLSMVYKEKQMGIDEGSEFVLSKLERSYSKLSDIGKKHIDQRYDSAKIVLTKKM